MSEYFYPTDGRKHYKDLEKAQKEMFVAAALRAGGAFAHSTIAMSVLNEMDVK